jgi:hypothetical protein
MRTAIWGVPAVGGTVLDLTVVVLGREKGRAAATGPARTVPENYSVCALTGGLAWQPT